MRWGRAGTEDPIVFKTKGGMQPGLDSVHVLRIPAAAGFRFYALYNGRFSISGGGWGGS